MTTAVCIVIMVLALDSLAHADKLLSSLIIDTESVKNSDMKKIIILKAILDDLEVEAEDDEHEGFDRVAATCEATVKVKTMLIADAEARITDMTSNIKELTTKSVRLEIEIDNLHQVAAKKHDTFDQVTAMHHMEVAELETTEEALVEAKDRLKWIISAVSKRHSGPLVQQQGSLLRIVLSLQHLLQQHDALLLGLSVHSEREALNAFIQRSQNYFKQSCTSQSKEITQILTQMQEIVAIKLFDSQVEKMQNQKAYENITAAGEQEFTVGQSQISTKRSELADTIANIILAKEAQGRLQMMRGADVSSLMMFKKHCAMMFSERAERQWIDYLDLEVQK
eukprot:gnl/TRDRNA2_/TRDRNA2_73720_c0_seq1.p1 gnl/TRDRNA2_/TRDRNA2_73720_c0~~gnl/TRDRNA2_/TRDRNA2_73720_c0_seq1.p1  ORF type:complete len:353 (+),score=104.64 gnl/TRDRNA2_/TRDRNA2_73720_c0_seq1:47-1060(+)